MRTLLFNLFIKNWPRKLLALILAMILWITVNHMTTVTKNIHSIPVRVQNLPPNKTIENMLTNGYLSKRVTLSITGHKSVLDELSSKDLQVDIDASGQPDQWIAKITKKNLVCANPNLDIVKAITKISAPELIIKESNLITDKIPIYITPVGDAPEGYQYLDIWPYRLYVTVTGPEELVKRLKVRGQKLSFSLSDIRTAELNLLPSKFDEVSYFVPKIWKKISIPTLSDIPFEIDDPQAENLRIDFSKQHLIPIEVALPTSIFFPIKYSTTLNPETYTLATNSFIIKKNGIQMTGMPLYASNVSRLFLDIVKDHLRLVIVASPPSERETMLWSIQFVNPQELENQYVARLSRADDDAPHNSREEILRNRFRKFMNDFRLYTADNEKLNLKIVLQANTITATPITYAPHES